MVVERLWDPDFISVEKIWFGPPVFAPRPPKGQNFKIFVFQRRAFKILLYTGCSVLISYQLENFGSGPPFWPPGPRKVKILKFLFFNVGPSNFYCILVLESWFHISWKVFVRAPFLAPRAPKAKNFKIFVFQRRTFKIYCILILVSWFHMCCAICILGPCFHSPFLSFT